MDKKDKKPKKYSAIGLRIQERMDALGLSQGALGKAASISQSAVSQMLSNENPSKHLPKLSIPLKSPFEWLAYGRGPKIIQEPRANVTIDADDEDDEKAVISRPESVTEEVSNFFTIYFREMRRLSPDASIRVKDLLRQDLIPKLDGSATSAKKIKA